MIVYLHIIKKPPKTLFMSQNWDDMFVYYVMFEWFAHFEKVQGFMSGRPSDSESAPPCWQELMKKHTHVLISNLMGVRRQICIYTCMYVKKNKGDVFAYDVIPAILNNLHILK